MERAAVWLFTNDDLPTTVEDGVGALKNRQESIDGNAGVVPGVLEHPEVVVIEDQEAPFL